MEDVMETCWIDSVTMCPYGYKCNSCPKDKEHSNKGEETSACVAQ